MLKRVLITGGAGFIGRRLVEHLVRMGSEVTVLDDFSSPSSRAPLDAARVVEGDVRNLEVFRRAAEGSTCLIHLACIVGVRRVVEAPSETESVILRGAENLVTVAREQRAHVVYFSSSEVSDPPRKGPRAVYALNKSKAERLLEESCEDFPLTIIRPFNVVGPDQCASQGMVLPSLARSAREGQALVVHGDGSQLRAFLHVEDFVRNLVALLVNDRLVDNRVYELGSQVQVSIREVAERLRALSGGRSQILFLSPEPEREDQTRRLADLSRLEGLVYFSVQHELDDILREALEV